MDKMNEILKIFEQVNIGKLTQFNYEMRLPRSKDLSSKCSRFEGATKVVYVFKDLDYVIKVPYQGYSYETSHWGDEELLYEEEFCYFTESFSKNGYDYCDAEIFIYDAAAAFDRSHGCNIKDLFARTEVATYSKDGFPIYIQPKCEIFLLDRFESSYSYKEIQSTELVCSSIGHECFSECWLTDVLKEYGEETTSLLLEFIDNNYITDLHYGNLGYLNGKPVLVDYAGYNEN